MDIIFINLCLCICCAFLLNRTKLAFPTRKKIFYFFAFIQIFYLRTFVNPYSLPDLSVYQNIFEASKYAYFKEIIKGEYLAVGETGYILLCKLCSLATNNFHFLLAVISIIWIYSYFNLFNKYSPYYYAVPILLLFVTEFPQSLFVLRQHLAIAIWLFAYPSIIKRDVKSFILIGILATSFHTTGVFFFPIYFIYGMMERKSFFYIVIALSICTLIGFNSINVINDLMGLSYDNYISGTKSGESNLTAFAIRLIYFLSYWFFCRTKIFEPGINRLVTTVMIFGIVIALCGTSFSLTGRIVRYFTPAVMLLVPIVMYNIKSKVIRYTYFVCILCLNAYITFFGSISEFLVGYSLI